jgi:SAM-dependent methyltransferase
MIIHRALTGSVVLAGQAMQLSTSIWDAFSLTLVYLTALALAIGVARLVQKHLWSIEVTTLSLLRLFLPLETRKRSAVWIDGQSWIPNNHSMSNRIIRDWFEKDPKAFHSFLWSNHLSYAKNYESVHAFGGQHLNLCRRMLFQDLKDFLDSQNGSLPRNFDIKSIFELGCSSGYLLRHFEETLFPRASIIEGMDIDEYAVEKGRKYLREHGSKIKLIHGDIAHLSDVMGNSKYDLILCAGVLAYLDENTASHVVQEMLSHSSGIVVIKEFAHPIIDNAELLHSEHRESDGALIHNVDSMIKKAGGIILHRRWYGAKLFDNQTHYSVFCRPAKYS